MVCLLATVAGGLVGCSSDYSPNTYASSAVQQANKVEPAVVAGYRQVSISANGTVGAVTGGAAGGILGAQVGSAGFNAALGTVGGTAVGSLIGTTLEHISGDSTGWEYIVRKPNGELLSLTQREPKPLPIGQKVLVITGSQARIVADYSTPAEALAGTPPEKAKVEVKAEVKAEPLEAPSTPPAAPPASVAGDSVAVPTGGGPIRLAAPVEPAPAAPPPVAAEPVPPVTPPSDGAKPAE